MLGGVQKLFSKWGFMSVWQGDNFLPNFKLKYKMKKSIKYISFAYLLLLMSCESKNAPFTADIYLIDHNGKPITEQNIKMAGDATALRRVDSKGHATINIDLYQGKEASGWVISADVAANDIGNKEPINCIFNNIGGRADKYIVIDTIRFDTLIPFPIQLKSKRKDLVSFEVKVFTRGIDPKVGNTFNLFRDTSGATIIDKARISIAKDLFKFDKKTKKSPLDTTIVANCLSKTFFLIKVKGTFDNAPFFLDVERKVFANTPRDKPFLIEF
jgi:hypothetical protein